jgi:hypothetical protein
VVVGSASFPPAPRVRCPTARNAPMKWCDTPNMEWAYAYGYSKKYASAGWASYERLFARWAECTGYDLDFATLHDLDADPSLLAGHRCAIFVGHDENWSASMRDAVDTFVAAGGKVARFAGNFLWRTRLGDEGRRQICHKYRPGTPPFQGPTRPIWSRGPGSLDPSTDLVR